MSKSHLQRRRVPDIFLPPVMYLLRPGVLIGTVLWFAGAPLAARFSLGPLYVLVRFMHDDLSVPPETPLPLHLCCAYCLYWHDHSWQQLLIAVPYVLWTPCRSLGPSCILITVDHELALLALVADALQGTILAVILTNLGTRKEGELSAYSIFNPGARQLPGEQHGDDSVSGSSATVTSWQ